MSTATAPAFEDELEHATRALQADDHEHALHHACGALALRPNAGEARAMILELSEHLDVPALLAGDSFAGTHAARALVLAERGQLGEAVSITAQLVDGLPERGFEHWLAEWAARLEGASVPVQSALPALGAALRIGMGRLRLLPSEREVVLPFATFARALTRTKEGSEHPELHSLASGLSRRTGDLEDALAMADRAIELGAAELGGIARGLALRALGRFEEADEAFESVRAVKNDPTMYLERARAQADAGHYREALALLRRGGARDDEELEETERWLEACAAGEAGARERSLDGIRRSITHGSIPVPSDASSNIIAQMPEGGRITRQYVTCHEGPSVRLCLSLAFADGDPRSVDYAFGAVATPDPREPWKRPVAIEPWRREGEVCVPALDPPDEATARAVRELAESPPDLTVWWERAGAIAERLGPDAYDALLGALVHPPFDRECPRAELVAAFFHAQVAATILLVRLEKKGWAGTRRRELLLSLLRGPQDWLTSAAILVGTELALHEPAALSEVREEIADLARHLPSEGAVTFDWALAFAAERLPLFPRSEAELIAQLLRDLYADSGDAPEEPPPASEASTHRFALIALGLVGLAVLALIALQCGTD